MYIKELDIFTRCHYRRLSGAILLVLFLSLTPVNKMDLMAGTYSPEQVKAAMLIKFTEFITWPEDAFESDPEHFVIGVLGSPEILKLLSSISGKKIRGRTLQVVRMEKWGQGPGIHMIYMASSVLEKWENQIRGNHRNTILTISDSDAFLKSGGMLSFVPKDGGRLGFAVNRSVQKQSRLAFSSSLLRLASIRTYEREMER